MPPARKLTSGADGADKRTYRTPLDPLPGESTKAYGAFLTYLNLGAHRSLDKVTEKGFADGSVHLWSRKFDWVNRAITHDAQQAGTLVEATQDAVRMYQLRVIQGAVADAELLRELWTKMMAPIEEALRTGGEVAVKDFLALIRARSSLDTLMRRTAMLPTTFNNTNALKNPDKMKDGDGRPPGEVYLDPAEGPRLFRDEDGRLAVPDLKELLELEDDDEEDEDAE